MKYKIILPSCWEKTISDYIQAQHGLFSHIMDDQELINLFVSSYNMRNQIAQSIESICKVVGAEVDQCIRDRALVIDKVVPNYSFEELLAKKIAHKFD